jgi:hypothetical protein
MFRKILLVLLTACIYMAAQAQELPPPRAHASGRFQQG